MTHVGRFRVQDGRSFTRVDDSTEISTSPKDRMQAAIDARLGKETRTADVILTPKDRMQAAIDARLGKETRTADVILTPKDRMQAAMDVRLGVTK